MTDKMEDLAPADGIDGVLKRAGPMYPGKIIGNHINGDIYDDAKKRFADGTNVTTSPVLSVDGDIIKTRNSVYRVEWLSISPTPPASIQAVEAAVAEKRAPVQGFSGGIPWDMHLRAYDAYCKRHGPQPALIDLEGRGCRGGFGVGELDMFIPGWREELSELASLKTALQTAEAQRDKLAKALEPFAAYMKDGLDLDNLGNPLPDEQGVGWVYLTHGDFRRAAALAASSPSTQGRG